MKDTDKKWNTGTMSNGTHYSSIPIIAFTYFTMSLCFSAISFRK